MYRYIIFLWNDTAEEERDAARAAQALVKSKHPSWKCQFCGPGVAVHSPGACTQDGGAIVLPDHSGILLGIAFRRSASRESTQDDRAIESLSPKYLARLHESEGRSAIDTLWGSYILVLTAKNGHSHYVLRSPASQLACFHALINRVHVFFSVVDDCTLLSPRPFAINWSVIRAQAVQRPYLTRETALAGVMEIESGECIHHAKNGLTHILYWNPCAISREPPFSNFAHASSSLRQETLRSVHCWASRYRRILLRLSGGLDSSIVLGCLAGAPTAPKILGINFHSPQLHLDERTFARSMATKTGTPLIEVDGDRPWDLSLFTRCARTARPVLSMTAPGRVHALLEVAQNNACDAIFDGELGDEVFGYQIGTAPLAVYLRRHGPFPGAFCVARDVARLKRNSLWRVLLEGFAEGVQQSSSQTPFTYFEYIARRYGDAFRVATREVEQDCYREASRFVHPWFAEQVNVDLSSIVLINALIVATSTGYHFPFQVSSDAAGIHPLISQPLIEVALRIPGHFSIRQGWNRSVARSSFSDLLSDDVRFRTSKVDMTPWVRRAIRSNLIWVREFLLEGILARENIIDADRIQAMLSNIVNSNTALINHLFLPLYMEGWLRQWTC